MPNPGATRPQVQLPYAPAAGTRAPINVQRPVGGMDLGALAQGAQAETGTRLQGGQDLITGYLNSLLGEQSAQHAAGTQRDLRMNQFRQQMQALAAAGAAEGQGQEMAARSAENQANRDFQGQQASLDRSFELGQAAATRQDEMSPLELYRGQRLIDQEFAEPPMSLSDFGTHEIHEGRGQLVSQDQDLRSQITSDPRWAEDRAKAADLIEQYGYTDQSEFQKKLRDLFGNRDRSASLALWDLGYRPGG